MEASDNLIEESAIDVESGYNTAKRLLAKSTPSAIIAIDDLTAIGTLQYCNDQKIAVPEEISITGFDDISLARFVSPRLTTIAQPVKKMAQCATKRIINKIKHRNWDNKNFVFEPEIILRESTNLSKQSIR